MSLASRILIGLRSLLPLAFLIASAAFLRSEISRRSFSARAATDNAQPQAATRTFPRCIDQPRRGLGKVRGFAEDEA
jgi:hypothetical protein